MGGGTVRRAEIEDMTNDEYQDYKGRVHVLEESKGNRIVLRTPTHDLVLVLSTDYQSAVVYGLKYVKSVEVIPRVKGVL